MDPMTIAALVSGGLGALGSIFGGKTSQIGSPADVSMLNQDSFNKWMNQLGGYNTGMYSGLTDATTNYNNLIAKMLSGQGQYATLTDPNAMANQFLGQQGNLAQLANQNVSGALSDVYSTGRAQAQASASDARKQAADQLASAGLLRSGGAVKSMTEATAQPIMQMETQLAQARANALQNQLAQLQSGYGTALQAGAGNALNMAQLGSQGYGNLANLYGNLFGTTTGQMSSLNEPQYYVPQYQTDNSGANSLMGLASILASLGK